VVAAIAVTFGYLTLVDRRRDRAASQAPGVDGHCHPADTSLPTGQVEEKQP
jgi:hypothetical protein